jgi:hypothetical protein
MWGETVTVPETSLLLVIPMAIMIDMAASLSCTASAAPAAAR